MISRPSASRTEVRAVDAVTAWADMVFLSRAGESGEGTDLGGGPPGAVPADQLGGGDDPGVAAAAAPDLPRPQGHARPARGGGRSRSAGAAGSRSTGRRRRSPGGSW